jgi:GT2 family glycosyltransferase
MIVLNFHGVGPVHRDIGPDERECWLDIARFEEVLDLAKGRADVSLTFDDGNASDCEIALPALLDRGLRATFFICSGRIGLPSFLDEARIRELAAAGMTIGSHGVDHRVWRWLGDEELWHEVADSRSELERVCGGTVDLAACPFGAYDRRVLAALRRAGYRAVFTSDGGQCVPGQWLCPRTTVRRSFSSARLESVLKGGCSAVRRAASATRVLVKSQRPRPLRIGTEETPSPVRPLRQRWRARAKPEAPETRPDVSVLIISFNTRHHIMECIRSVMEQTRRHSHEIIVVDNMSRDGSVEAIRQGFPQVRLIESTRNLGFAGGNNAAARYATGRRLLLLNPDTVVLNGAVDALLDFADSMPDALVWVGRAVLPDGSVNASCLNDMTLWSSICRAAGFTWMFPRSRIFNPEAIHMWDALDRPRRVGIVVGCFLMIEKSLWDRLGGFNPAFFMYGDEVDLCLRARKLGARPWVTPDATIIHHGGGSEPSGEDKLVKVLKGRVTVMMRHWRPAAAMAGRRILTATAALRALASLVLRPPQRQGRGQDGRTDVWAAVFRRRGEWSAGWEVPGSDADGCLPEPPFR